MSLRIQQRTTSPSWSSDERWIAYLRRFRGYRNGVYLVPALGGPERKLAEIFGPPRPGPTTGARNPRKT